MLIAAFIFVLSFAALIQFGLLQWRAGLIQVAAAGVASDTVGVANLLTNKGFGEAVAFQKLCPSAPRLRSVRLYHGCLQMFAGLGATDWVKREINLCARYAEAVLMQQVARNQALAAAARSF
jgi:hypothetical protein